MKKLIALLLAMLMVLALCACGDTAEEATEEAVVEETAVEEAAPAEEAPAAEEEAPAEEVVIGEDGVPEGEASGEAQAMEAWTTDGYDKTFDGYKAYVSDAMSSNEGNPFLADELATVEATTEDTYDPTANPFAMQIEFGLILTYEDFLKA